MEEEKEMLSRIEALINSKFETFEQRMSDTQKELSQSQLSHRQKCIKLTDSSEHGWNVVNEYEAHPLADNSDDEKKIYKAQMQAERKVQRERRTRSRRYAPYSLSGNPSSGTTPPTGTRSQAQMVNRKPGCLRVDCRVAQTESQVDKNIQISHFDSVFSCSKLNSGVSENEILLDTKLSNKTEMLSKSVPITSDNGDVLVSPVGRLRSSYKHWQAAGAGEYILDIVRNGYKLPFKKIPTSVELNNNKSARDNTAFVSKEIQNLLLKGCIREKQNIKEHLTFKVPRIYSINIKTDIQFRFATTLISSRVANPANYSQETLFDVILPEEAFISNFTLEIDGKIYPGIVKDKDEAKKEYEKAKKKGKTTGLVSQKPRDSRTFKVRVSVAAFSKSSFNLTYQELLKRVKGAYEHKVFINPGYPVDDIKISVAIQESRDITRLTVPPIKSLNELLTADVDFTENDLAVITRPTKRSAYIQYSASRNDQSTEGLSGQFIVQYDIDRSLDGGDVLVVNGYFVHFLAPDIQKAIPKDVLFVLDISGSMSGRKIIQLKEAMYVILDELEEGDRFNIITFNGNSKQYKSGMIDVTKDSLFKAKEFIHSVYANGWTDINKAVLDGIDVLKVSKQEGERSPIVVFLTDGHPTSGVQNDQQILQNINRDNEGEIPIFSLAFGSDADWSLVKKMAIQNDGVARKIYEDSDSDLQISGFYDELAVTLLNNVTVKYLGDSVEEQSLTKSEFKNYFQGSELVVAGKLNDAGAPTVNMEILSNSVEGSLILTGDKDLNFIDVSDTENLMDLSDFQTITEKTWAYLTIKQLLNRADGELNKTAVDIMKSKAKELSLQYGFVTPLTSMVVTKPEVDPNEWRPPTTTTTPKPTTARSYHRYGGGGYGGGGGGDPHYMIRIKNMEHPICFDVQSNDGEVHNLITDPRNKITINTQIISGLMGTDGEPKTYIGEVSIKMAHHILVITTSAIIFDTKVFPWTEEKLKHFGGHEFMLSDHGLLLTIRFKFGAEILIRRHVHKSTDTRANYLNIYVKHEDSFNKKTTGLIGQFVNGFKHIYLRKLFKNKSGQTMAKLQIKEGEKFPSIRENPIDTKDGVSRQRIPARLIQRSEVIEKGTEMCWMVHKKFIESLIGSREAFLKDDFIDIE
ncbi:inter-alpha-trypsin inhibitor heavy chain H3-like [Ruditapes philippinarum]|uniref:inter-alpha-trypsin inhibitor heavy chain H3-like n=1 Tax=Ruditapes philippinarum TaxID=129788 RepID=UPI00295A6593|nr:inter-alpha-trypsin inhibitor heavy chain H3-like [Ruditapes philippinarum]